MTKLPVPPVAARLRRNVRMFYGWLGSMVVLVVAPLVALRLIEHESVIERAAAVVLGIGGFLPWAWVLVTIIRRGDEFTRRLHLVASAFAFGGAVLLTATLAWLARAGFIPYPDLTLLWGGFMLVWVVALAGAKYYFERTP